MSSEPFRPAPAGGRRLAAATAAGLLWLAAAAGGLLWLDGRSGAAGQPGRPPAAWPADSTLTLDPARPTLLMFVHPHCPCSRASVSELAAVLAARPDRARATVVFYTPDGAADDWTRTDLWDRAAAIPGATVRHDPGEGERRRFAALTSGQLLAFTPDGRLAYAGGLTRGRGVDGPNPGRAAVEAVIAGRPAAAATAPVFGCPLTADAPEGR